MQRGMPLEVGRMTKSLPFSEPLLRLASLAIAHGWGWYQSGGSHSGVSTGCHVHELRMQDGAPVRQGWSGRHVHELRVPAELGRWLGECKRLVPARQ